MRTPTTLALLFCSVMGCASTKNTESNGLSALLADHKHRALLPPPPSWKENSTWVFVALDKSSHIERSIAFRLTNDPASTCISGSWKKLEVVSDSSQNTYEPAYSINDSSLSILLSTELCDSYDEYVGTLDANGFIGMHRYSGLRAYEEFGLVYGVPVSQ